MDPDALGALRLLLVAIVLLCGCYFMVPSDEPKADQPRGRDYAKEHILGAHRHTPAPGCRDCEKR